MDLLKAPEEKIMIAYQSCDPLFCLDFSASENKEVLRRYGIQIILFCRLVPLKQENQLGLIERL